VIGIQVLLKRVIDQPLSRDMHGSLILIKRILDEALKRAVEDDGSTAYLAVKARELIDRTGRFCHCRDFISVRIRWIDQMATASVCQGKGVNKDVVARVQEFFHLLWDLLEDEPESEGGE
jgi:hypothetical protein